MSCPLCDMVGLEPAAVLALGVAVGIAVKDQLAEAP